jgi:hypothetical protein
MCRKNLPRPVRRGIFLLNTLKIYRLQTISYRSLIVSCKRPVAVLFLHRHQNKDNRQTDIKEQKSKAYQQLPKGKVPDRKLPLNQSFEVLPYQFEVEKILQGGFEEFTYSRSVQSRNGFFISSLLAVLLQFYRQNMKKWCFIVLFLLFFSALPAAVSAQCSICTKTAQQLGEKPAKGFNTGIIYLALCPFLIVGYIGYRWYKNNSDQ